VETESAMKNRNPKVSAKTLLNAIEIETAGATPVWVVWWEEPERSWESICLSPAECESEYETRQTDPLIKHWGKVGKRDRQSLLEWLEGHLRSASPGSESDFVNPVKEILRRVSRREPGPVVVRTW
jgi:hypothetical protein